MRFPLVSRSATLLWLSGALALSACANLPAGLASTPARGYSVETSQSHVGFTTTKSGAAGVGGIVDTMQFKRYSGGVDAAGKIVLQIDLASIDSGIEIRDDRMRHLLWNVRATPHAIFTAQLPAGVLGQITHPVQDIDLEGQLQMAGQTRPVKASLKVGRLNDRRLWVATRQPIVVNANDFGLRAGVEALRESVGLHFLGSSASVSLNLTLRSI